MKIEYTPERGRGFVRPGETEKQQNWGFSGIKKAAPKWSRLSEQITRCAVCVCDPKHKHGDDSRYQAGGQCNQSGSVRCHTCNERFSLYSLRNCSRAKAHGANLSDSCSIFLRRLFRAGDNVLVNSLSVIVLSCIAMRRNTSHHGADSDYSDSLALRRWRRLISPSSAETINCPVLSPSSFKFSTASAIACGTRASSFLDFALTAFVAISDFLVIRWLTVYTQENGKTLLTWLTPVTNIVADTFIKVIDEKTKPRKCRYHSQGF
ncbi:putative prophage protein [Escherichia coli 042]|uniref:Icd-like protein n=2 Tax=Enterobacteriaceae TaxID=543 RepID=A0A2S8DF66_SHIDY|nr:hypothetical protein [Escherichia coli]EFW0124770.1 hypothetical protein [Shigella dysenteriae]EFW49358.1 hypothetical protein SDB_03361 [Shigella dysenteriae CDC 74-1112]EIO28525.1 putative prophage protein [Escherichia coli PA40]EKH42894.1 putative prophage protein [Escherichia coli NE1487]EQU37685.1 hypothetical protein G854_01320 [Escherichia coli HVH 202 (4-3163997)]ERB35189.1 hypothetical protein G960_01799 [Escherichia coli UMEA 3292-1]QJZ56522.1 hypothetical protein E4U65_12790 [E